MTTKRDINNPWSNKPSSGNAANSKSNKGSATVKPKTKQADQKFKEAKEKHEEYAKKHNILEYDSSSDEDLETGSMLGIIELFRFNIDLELKIFFFTSHTESVFKNYVGDNSELQRTQDFLENVFQSGAATCLICIATVKRSEAVRCFFFECLACHLPYRRKFPSDMVMRTLFLLFPSGLHSALGKRFNVIEKNAIRIRSRLLQQSWRIDRSTEESGEMGLSQVSQRLPFERGLGKTLVLSFIAFNFSFWKFFADTKALHMFLQQGTESTKSSMVDTTFVWQYLRKSAETGLWT